MDGRRAILDFDGVLADNVAFEKGVTTFIVHRLASLRRIQIDEAFGIWQDELLQSKAEPAWYDYDFHCIRLGIPAIAREAHEKCLPLLRAIPGAGHSLEKLSKSNIEICIASDAMEWVVDFKVQALGFRKPDLIISSEHANASKATVDYWNFVKSLLQLGEVNFFVDNRVANLRAARSAISTLRLVYFEGDEHVLGLREIIEGNDYGSGIDHSTMIRVSSHHELLTQILSE